MSKHINITVDFADVKMDALAIMDGTIDVDLSREYRHGAIPQMTGMEAPTSFYGGTPAQTREWIRNGYSVGAKVAAQGAAPRKRTRWREEGDELSLERAWSGDPTPFATREPGTKTGIRVEFDADFAGSTPPSVLADFGRWLAELTAGYAASGHDLEIVALYYGKGLYDGKGAPTSQTFRVQLKRFGQQSDYAAWSSLFSPTGFRHLIFSMWSVYGARKGWRTNVAYGFGNTSSKTWSVEYAADVLRVGSPYFAHSFPADRMTELAKAAFKP